MNDIFIFKYEPTTKVRGNTEFLRRGKIIIIISTEVEDRNKREARRENWFFELIFPNFWKTKVSLLILI